ncbi:hypothetical protein PF008_g3790 [Phytophthora fragariae]|uniref:Reverse transcriptase domain-containing protein n=1 Tax=Phytophthora fragariae TaxID=53985 RepID=A0A6G0SD55_9STRA|nr:hypothetical protein PF008_g3790 [Phytophthora fragariae]
MTFEENIERGQSATCHERPCRRQSVDCDESGCRNERFGNTTSATCDEGETLAPLLTKTRTAAKPASAEPVIVTEVRIGDKTFPALIDAGCSRSAIGQGVVDQVRGGLVLRKEEATFKQADKLTGKTTHVATTPLSLLVFSNTRVCTHEFRVAPQLLYPVMLGKDFFSEQGIDLLFSSKELEWDGVRVPMPKPRVRGSRPGLMPYQEDTSCLVEISVAEDCGPVDYDYMIDARNLTHDEVLLALAFLKEFHDVASGRLGEIKGEPYELPLPRDAKPFACHPFPVTHIHLVATKQEIQKLVKLGVMSPDNSSPWASPAFTILKKDGSIRLLCDFRRLNALLQRRFFPLPVIPEILREFQRCKFISVFDVPMGYYARVLAKRSRAATAIVFHWGKFVFNRLPMGVSTAPFEFFKR